jgi:hypothetical protein
MDVIMPSIAVVPLACVAIFFASLAFPTGNGHRSAERTEVVAQYCMPADDYPDADRLYC